MSPGRWGSNEKGLRLHPAEWVRPEPGDPRGRPRGRVRERRGGPERVASSYGGLLEALTDADRFPALHEMLDANAFDADPENYDPDAEFTFGLERVLDGIDALVRTRP